MKIDINALRFNRYSIIYGLSDAERSEMTEQILTSDPEYRLRIDDSLEPIKFGPFTMKNKKTIREIMMKNKAVKAKGEKYALRQLEYLDGKQLFERLAMGLSGSQRELITFIIDVTDGKKQFLFSDENVKAEHRFVDYAAWLNTQGFMLDKGYKAVWLSMLSADEVVELIKEKAPDTRTYWDFYSIKNGEIIFEDNLFARKEKEKYIRQEEAKARRKAFDIAAENKNYNEIYRLGIEIDADEYADEQDKMQAYLWLGEMSEYGLDRDIDIEMANSWYAKGVNSDDRIVSRYIKISNILNLENYKEILAVILESLRVENPDMSANDINIRARLALGEMADKARYKALSDDMRKFMNDMKK
ncbi:MAG: hypothetical protein IJN84_06685 [Clostridia bacterium]|nr:hypothetical protein [Clostridia bacterium]